MSGVMQWAPKHVLTIVGFGSELALLMTPVAGPFSPACRLVAVPAYAAHLVLFRVAPGLGYWIYAGIFLATLLAADRLRSAVSARFYRPPRPPSDGRE